MAKALSFVLSVQADALRNMSSALSVIAMVVRGGGGLVGGLFVYTRRG